jgi:hypothetical protein
MKCTNTRVEACSFQELQYFSCRESSSLLRLEGVAVAEPPDAYMATSLHMPCSDIKSRK